MFKKVVVLSIFFTVVPFLVCASEMEKTTSFYQGTWTGEWEGWVDPQIRQGATLIIGKELREGVYQVLYSWDAVSYRRGNVPAGKVKTEGTAKDDTFFFSWENKQGKKFEITLRKQDENTVKARLERPGPTGPMERPYSEALLKRK